ncbi:MAG: enoyl-CoA hydratase, partial [Chloroflexi bacterium]|nr:enoyl-CoA hydratase [Chloroflexota bacterium]
MTYTAIEFETDGPIATITMDRPDKRNALNHALLDDLLAALNVVADDDSLKVAILRANGPAFSAGYDIDGSP